MKGHDMNDSRIVPVFQILAEDIQALGIRAVFGLMSDDTAVFAVTLDGLGVKFVGARHENNAIAMAEGYAYSTGELGVALIGRGPATANGLHAAVGASRTGSKVLVIYGDAAVGSGAVNGIGPDYKGFNAQAVLGAAGLTCFTAASAATARQTLADAMAAASHGALAALLLPTNVQMMNVEVSGPAPKLTAASQPTGARRQSIDAAAALLSGSRRPVIVAGMAPQSPFTPPRTWPGSRGSTSRSISRRLTRPAPWIPVRWESSSTGCCLGSAPSFTTPVISSASCPTSPSPRPDI